LATDGAVASALRSSIQAAQELADDGGREFAGEFEKGAVPVGSGVGTECAYAAGQVVGV
jgi:hypothetical protein